MIFNDTNTTTRAGLVQDCEITLFGDNGYTQVSSDSDRLATFTNFLNRALDKVTTLILASDGRWQFDDTNYTDLPIGISNLINNQQDYTLAVTHLKVLRVEIMGVDGKYYRIEPLDQADILYQGMTELMNGQGQPKYYDIQGSSVLLYPKPQTNYVTFTSGLKVFFQRGASYFATTDTTKTPGIATIFHRLVSRWACYDYALARQLPIKADLRQEITVLEQELKDFYATRDNDDKPKFNTVYTQWN